jgi:hypothetical protein
MSIPQRPKNKDGGPTLKRDANNKLDMDDAARVTHELTKKLLQEERAHKKDISFNAKGNKRDFVVMFTILQRNTVDGHIVFGEDESKGFEVMDPRDPFKYRVYDYVEAPMLARDIPMSKATTGKQLLGVFNVLVNYLARLGIINNV